jgi:hypothetical protein
VEGVGNVSKSAATATTFWLVLAKAGSYLSVRTIAMVWLASTAI